MTENAAHTPTDAELIAAIHRSIELGHMIEVTDEWLAARRAELDNEPVDAEIVSDQCELGYRGCTGTGQLAEDPYEADVNNHPGQLIVACDVCLTELANDI